MSSEEINQQVGKAFIEYSSAKKALAHSDSLLAEVAGQYELIAKVLHARAGSNFTIPEQMLKEMGAREVSSKLTLAIEDGQQLAEILAEHQAVKKRVAEALAALRGFGFGNVE